jgi:hypothetical protein
MASTYSVAAPEMSGYARMLALNVMSGVRPAVANACARVSNTQHRAPHYGEVVGDVGLLIRRLRLEKRESAARRDDVTMIARRHALGAA